MHTYQVYIDLIWPAQSEPEQRIPLSTVMFILTVYSLSFPRAARRPHDICLSTCRKEAKASFPLMLSALTV